MNIDDLDLIKQVANFETKQNAHSLPAEAYQAGIFVGLDKTHVLHRSWQLVTHMNFLENHGDYVVHQVVDQPIIVVNTGDGIKAFHNVCRHRAGPLALENGHSKTLRCKYHGWNYQLNGQLKSAPEMHTTSGFDVSQYRLSEIKVDCWQGLVFVALNEQVPVFEDLVTGIKEQITPIDISSMKFHRRDDFMLDCNWKVYVENYLEGYHLPHIHPGLNKLLDYKSYQTEVSQWHSYQFSPLEQSSGLEGQVCYGEGQAHYYYIYPNTMLNILPNRLQTNQILPVSNNKTRVVFDYYYHPTLDDINTLVEQDRVFSNEVQHEDIMICEAVQKGLDSGHYKKGRLCMKREMGVFHFQQLVRSAYQQFLVES